MTRRSRWQRTLRYVFLTIVLAGLVVAGVVGYVFYDVAQQFARTDRIVHGGHKIADAIEAYEQANGQPPGVLKQLVPAQLNEVPVIEGLERIDYTLEPQMNTWLLELHSDRERVYLHRSDGSLRPSEAARMIGYVHGFRVLEPNG